MPETNTVPDGRPELFDIRAMPEQPKILKPGQLEESLIRQFFEKGYLLVPKFFTEEELEPCRKAIEKLVDDLAQKLYDGGKIKNMYKEHGLFDRLTYIEKEFPGANIILYKYGTLPKEFCDLWANERLLNVVEQLIGPEVMGTPVWNLRTKVPQNEATTVPWHQDAAYMDNDAYNVLQPTVWIPLVDTNQENGCMEMISGGHLTGKVARHTCCWRDTWYIELDKEDAAKTLNVDFVNDKVLCPVPYGGMLLLNNMIGECLHLRNGLCSINSLNNCSDVIRWSLDFRWQVPDKPVGYFGLKKGILMRSEKTPVEKIDWDTFNSVDRIIEAAKNCTDEEEQDPFDNTLAGPWMLKWEMTHTNRHTEKLKINKD